MISEPMKALCDRAEKAEAERDALKSELERLCDPLLKEVSIEPGAMEMTLEGSTVFVKRMAIAMVTFLEGNGAKNYVQQEISLRTNNYVMLVMRCSGKTPHQLREEAEKKAEDLRFDLLTLIEQVEYSAAEPCMKKFATDLRLKLGPFCNDEGADLSNRSVRHGYPCIKSPRHAGEHRDAQGFCWGPR